MLSRDNSDAGLTCEVFNNPPLKYIAAPLRLREACYERCISRDENLTRIADDNALLRKRLCGKE